jgi:phosphatidylserine/phosphatidylglycerophosphate/cardiolipin synthase-like enzyme
MAKKTVLFTLGLAAITTSWACLPPDTTMQGERTVDGGAGADGRPGAPDSGPGTLADAGMTNPNDVSIIVEPSDDASGLVAAINGAKTSVHMTMYLLTSSTVISALINRHKAGVEVKVILNQTFPTGTSTDNSSVFSQLQTAGVSVVYAASTFTYTHEKCVIIDGKVAWIMTMNTTTSAPTNNREYLAVDTDPNDVAEADAIFTADYAHTAITPSGHLLVAPVNARDRMVVMINGAHSTIDLEGEEFSDSTVASALATAAVRGARVRIVLSNATPSANQTTAIATVKAKGATVVVQSSPYIHAKAMVVDGTSAYVGSANFSTGSLLYNRELGLIVTNPTELAKISSTIATDFSTGTVQ